MALIYSVAVMGKGRLASHILRSLRTSDSYEVMAVVPSIDPARLFEKLEPVADQAGIPILDSKGFRDLTVGLDLLVCSSYDNIMSEAEIARHGRVLNFHNSLLPAFRGVRPINWALETGSSSHGVTLHEIDKGVDSGDLIDQQEFKLIDNDEDVLDIYLKCVDAGILLFERNRETLMTSIGIPQATSKGSYYGNKDSHRLTRFKELSNSSSKIEMNLPL